MIGLIGFAFIGGMAAPLVNAYLENASSVYWGNFLTVLPDSFKQQNEGISSEAKKQYDICVTV